MKTQSDQAPPLYLEAQDSVLVNFNVEERSIEDNGISKLIYDYEQAIVCKNPCRSDIISAVIRALYTYDDELALINNLNRVEQRYIIEYEQYQSLRDTAKVIADDVLGQMMSSNIQ
jgi:hypothetical protein